MDWDGYYAVGFEFGIHLFAIDALLYAGIPLAGHAYILGVYDGYAPGGGGGAGAGGAGAGDGGGGGGDGGPPYHGADVHGLNPGSMVYSPFDVSYSLPMKMLDNFNLFFALRFQQIHCKIQGCNPDHEWTSTVLSYGQSDAF